MSEMKVLEKTLSRLVLGLAFMILVMGIGTAEGGHWPQGHRIEKDDFSLSEAQVALVCQQVGTIFLTLKGPTKVEVDLDSLVPASPPNRESVNTEMVELILGGNTPQGPVLVTLRSPTSHPAMRSLGKITESNNTQQGRLDLPPFAPSGSADSFFDVFFEVRVGSMVFHNDVPKHMEAVITHKPPSRSTVYLAPQPIDLFDESHNKVCTMGSTTHVPVPPERQILTVTIPAQVVSPVSIAIAAIGIVIGVIGVIFAIRNRRKV